MNKLQKGIRTENELATILKNAGWIVIQAPHPVKFRKNNDFCNLFDMLCLKGKYRKWIQVKCNKKPDMKPFKEWAEKFANEYDIVEVWIKKDYEGWFTYSVNE
jgi:Holliday junction resolvase